MIDNYWWVDNLSLGKSQWLGTFLTSVLSFLMTCCCFSRKECLFFFDAAVILKTFNSQYDSFFYQVVTLRIFLARSENLRFYPSTVLKSLFCFYCQDLLQMVNSILSAPWAPVGLSPSFS